MREMYDKQGNSQLVPDQQVQEKLRSGWVFFKKPESAPSVEKKSITKTKTTTRPRATMRITKAEAEVIKPFNEEDN
jgi:hypothetical protein